MISRHKKKAFIGVAVWFAAFLLMIATSVVKHEVHRAGPGGYWVTLNLLFLAVQYVAFFWGGQHLAKAKGQTTGLLVFGVFLPAQIVLLGILFFALPDRFARQPAPAKTPRRHESQLPALSVAGGMRWWPTGWVWPECCWRWP
jgi:hypothetical protein